MSVFRSRTLLSMLIGRQTPPARVPSPDLSVQVSFTCPACALSAHTALKALRNSVVAADHKGLARQVWRRASSRHTHHRGLLPHR